MDIFKEQRVPLHVLKMAPELVTQTPFLESQQLTLFLAGVIIQLFLILGARRCSILFLCSSETSECLWKPWHGERCWQGGAVTPLQGAPLGRRAQPLGRTDSNQLFLIKTQGKVLGA